MILNKSGKDAKSIIEGRSVGFVLNRMRDVLGLEIMSVMSEITPLLGNKGLLGIGYQERPALHDWEQPSYYPRYLRLEEFLNAPLKLSRISQGNYGVDIVDSGIDEKSLVTVDSELIDHQFSYDYYKAPALAARSSGGCGETDDYDPDHDPVPTRSLMKDEDITLQQILTELADHGANYLARASAWLNREGRLAESEAFTEPGKKLLEIAPLLKSPEIMERAVAAINPYAVDNGQVPQR